MERSIKKQILLIEPNRKTRNLILEQLTNALDCELYVAETVREIERIFENRPVDLVITELMLEKESMLPLLSQLRESTPLNREASIIVVSNECQIESKIKAFTQGADDFLSKPFHPRELSIRVKKFLGFLNNISGISCENSQINLDQIKREIVINRIKVKLTITEFQIVYCLIQNQSFCEHQFLKQFLSTQKGKPLNETAMRVSIKRLRDKLEKSTGMKVIKNRHGQGYYLGI